MLVLVISGKGSIDMAEITDMEQEAVKAARSNLYSALLAQGLEAPFESRSGEDIDRIIWAVITGFRAAMHQRSAKGDVPFPVGAAP